MKRTVTVAIVGTLLVTTIALLAADALAIKAGWVDASAFPLTTEYIYSWLTSPAWAGAGALATALIAPALYMLGRNASDAASKAQVETRQLTERIAGLTQGTHDLQVELAAVAKSARLDELVNRIEVASSKPRFTHLTQEALELATGSHDIVRIASAHYGSPLSRYPVRLDETVFRGRSREVQQDIADAMIDRLGNRYSGGLRAENIWQVKSLSRLCSELEVSLKGIAEFIVDRACQGDRLTHNSIAILMNTRYENPLSSWEMMSYTLASARSRIEGRRTPTIYEWVSGMRDDAPSHDPRLTGQAAIILMWGVGSASRHVDGKPDKTSLQRLETAWTALLGPDLGLVAPPGSVDGNQDEEYEEFVAAVLTGLAALYSVGGRAPTALKSVNGLLESFVPNSHFQSISASAHVEWTDEDHPEPEFEPEPGDLIERAVGMITERFDGDAEIHGLVAAVSRAYPRMTLDRTFQDRAEHEL